MASLDIPNPLDTPDPWDSLTFTQAKASYVWPSNPEHGYVEWSSFKPAVKLDKKDKSGAAKPRITTTNGKGIEFSFTLHVVADNDDARTTAATVLDKLRAGAGPFGVKSHPWAAAAGVRGFLVESVEYFPPDEGELRITISCSEVDPDAQSGTGKNVVKTPSKEDALKRAQDEWLARARQAQAFTNNQMAIDVQNRADEARANGEPAGQRVPKKLKSVFVGEDEIGTTPNVKKQPDPGNVATGKVS